MGALAKLLSYPDKILAAFFLRVLPELLRLSILAVCMLYKHYKLMTSKYKYTSMIKKGSLRFSYRRKARPELGECSVCLSEFAEGEEGSEVMECKHAFHRNCLERWLKGYAATCPLCRSLVVPEVVAAEYKKMQIEGEDDWIEKELALILLNALASGSCNGFF